MVENLNYPPKFNAVYELIEEGFVNDSQEPITFKHQEIEAEPQKYTFSKEDKNIYRLAQKFPQITAQDILQANPHIDPADLRGGEELTIPSLTARPTLRVLAKKNNKSISRLQDLNPAVRDPDLPLPYGYKLRI
jgi:LysM repeat protein